MHSEVENEVGIPEIRKLGGGTGLWRDKEGEADVILAISNHMSSTGENPGQQHLGAPAPQLSAPSPVPGLLDVGRGRSGEGTGCQVAGFGSISVFQQPVPTSASTL